MPRRPPVPLLDIRLLGPPEVLVDGHPLQVDTRKAVAILVLLAADARPYAREELAALLWPDSDGAAAHGALRRTLSVMRGAIPEDALRIERARVWLDPADTRIDLGELERLAEQGTRAGLTAAAALARGPFLAGFSLRDSADFDDWRAARAVAVERLVLGVLDRLAAAAEAAGDLSAAIEAAARRLDLDPLDEGAHVRLMELYDATGDPAAAVRQYRTCVAVLERELGVSPLAATTARYEAIRDATPLPAPAKGSSPRATVGDAGPHTVSPRPVSPPLIGRDADLAAARRAVAAIVADGDGRVVSITGEAGIGKTRLSESIVHDAQARGGAVLATRGHPAEAAIAYGAIVDLLRAAQRDPTSAARLESLDPSIRRELARLVPALEPGRRRDVRPDRASADATAHARLVAAIADGLAALVEGDGPGVLWIDDLHWLDGASLEALAVLARRLAGRPLLLLLAWREEDVPAEATGVVRALAATAHAHIELDRLPPTAVATLVDRMRPDDLSAGERQRIESAAEGLPLYVVEALAAVGTVDAASVPPGVGAILRSRLDVIDETSSQILAAAAIIGRSFDVATVRHASGRSEEETVDALDRLVARALVREGADGYDFAHGALRDLVDAGIGLARRRLLHQRAAEALRLDLGGVGRNDLGRWTGIAIHERLAGRTAEAAEAHGIAASLAESVYAHGSAVELATDALALGHPDAFELHALIGRARTRLGDYPGAVMAFEAAAARAVPRELPAIEWQIGRARLRRGDLSGADRHLATAAEDPDAGPALRARAWVDRSVVARRAGDVGAAREAARQGLALAETAGDGPAIGAARRMLGLCALDSGDASMARVELDGALRAAESDPDPTSAIAARVGLALTMAAGDDIEAALAQGDAALEACRTIGDRHLEAAVEDHLADLLHAAGRDDEARDHQRRAATAFAELGGDPTDPDPGIWMLAAW
jgi:DNA-binding SARP family transcriptional activator/ABC-type dipeptide/oligopeptide/nickel transport system ATPase subunit